MEGKEAPAAGAPSPFMPMFEQFRAELDEHHDRRERTIKASRDITAASKKIVRNLAQPLPHNVSKGNEQYYNTIRTQVAAVALDLQQLNSWRYARQISGGCQEYIEAASFQHYLTTSTLLTYEQAAAQMRALDSEGPGVSLSVEDYLLGIYDMTGELMRFAITAMATGGALPSLPSDPDVSMSSGNGESDKIPVVQRNLLTDMRALRSALETLNPGSGPFGKEVDKKLDVMQTSVEKVEKALYGLVVRGAERPKGWMPETEGSGQFVKVES